MGWTEAADLIVKGMEGAINAKTVNNRRFFKSVALLKTDASIFAAIFSANDTIFISLKLLLVSRIGEKNPSPSLFELNT